MEITIRVENRPCLKCANIGPIIGWMPNVASMDSVQLSGEKNSFMLGVQLSGMCSGAACTLFYTTSRRPGFSIRYFNMIRVLYI